MNIGQQVTVIRRGLMSTGWVGTIVNIGDKIEVKFPHRANTLKFSPKSLNIARPKPKKVKELSFLYDEDEVVRIYYKRDGKIANNLTRFESYDKVNDIVKFIHNQHIKREDIVLVATGGMRVKFNKPKEDAFPFWTFREEVKELKIRGVDTTLNVFQCENGYFMHPDWLDKNPVYSGFELREVDAPVELPQDDEATHKAYLEVLNNQFPQEDMKRTGMSFALFYFNSKNKPKLYLQKGAACHYAMKTVDGEVVNNDKCIFKFGVQFITRAYHGSTNAYKEQTKKYLEWVMNDSPWSRYIITKSFDEALVSGIKVRIDIPSNAMMCTFYALRYPTEYKAKIERWNYWVNAGMNPSAAYFVAETDDMKRDTRSHHQLLDTASMSLDSVKNFINNGVGKTVTELYSKRRRYSDVSIHHGEDDYNGNTGVTDIRKMDIYGNEEVNIGTAFNVKMGKAIDEQKLVNVMNSFVG